jgi:predicted transposase YbfD/YdcC
MATMVAIETGISMVCTDIDWLQEDHAWPGLVAIGKLVRIRATGTTVSTEAAYYLLSTTLTAKRFGEVARAHWAVENSLHWVLDVAMNEDRPERNRLEHGPQNLALLRHMTINLVKLEGSKVHACRTRDRRDQAPILVHQGTVSRPGEKRQPAVRSMWADEFVYPAASIPNGVG